MTNVLSLNQTYDDYQSDRDSEDSLRRPFTFYSNSRKKDAIAIEWKNLNYYVAVKDPLKHSIFRPVYKNKHVLKRLNGSAYSGELLAIMGPSGCGKTTMLNVLAGRVSSADRAYTKMSGTVEVNGMVRDDRDFRHISAYVLQDDRLYPHLTVFETLMMAAHFYLSSALSLSEKEVVVSAVLTELDLLRVRDTPIGDETVKGISCGERKRANIAVQLIADPSVMFLDEPTTGLDSHNALSVIKALKHMALNGRLIIVVIHQPRSTIFDMFDKVMLLSEGRCMYHGDAALAAEHFETLGFKCPRFFNPADFYLDIMSPDLRSVESKTVSLDRVTMLADAWSEKQQTGSYARFSTPRSGHFSPISPQNSRSTRDMGFGFDVAESRKLVRRQFVAKNPSVERFRTNLRLLFWRSWTEQIRGIFSLCSKILSKLVLSFTLGGIYSNLGNSSETIQDKIGLLFVIVLSQAMNGVMGVLYTFPKEKIIVNRERANYAYNFMSYFTAKFLEEMPINLATCFVSCIITYWLVGLNPRAERFVIFVLVLMLQTVVGVALGLAVSAGCTTTEESVTFGLPLVITAVLFGGLFINLETLPIIVNWFPYMSFVKWAFEALCINEFAGQTYECPEYPGCVVTGEQTLESLDFHNNTVGGSVLGLFLLLLFFILVAIVVLYFSRITYTPLGHIGHVQRHYFPLTLESDYSIVSNCSSSGDLVPSPGPANCTEYTEVIQMQNTGSEGAAAIADRTKSERTMANMGPAEDSAVTTVDDEDEEERDKEK